MTEEAKAVLGPFAIAGIISGMIVYEVLSPWTVGNEYQAFIAPVAIGLWAGWVTPHYWKRSLTFGLSISTLVPSLFIAAAPMMGDYKRPENPPIGYKEPNRLLDALTGVAIVVGITFLTGLLAYIFAKWTRKVLAK